MDKIKIGYRIKEKEYEKVYNFSLVINKQQHVLKEILKDSKIKIDEYVMQDVKEDILQTIFDEINDEIRNFCYENIHELVKLERITAISLSTSIDRNKQLIEKIKQLQWDKFTMEEIK